MGDTIFRKIRISTRLLPVSPQNVMGDTSSRARDGHTYCPAATLLYTFYSKMSINRIHFGKEKRPIQRCVSSLFSFATERRKFLAEKKLKHCK